MTQLTEDAPTLWLIRHGETAWSRTGQHTGRTDLSLTEEGCAQAKRLVSVLADVAFDKVLLSPRLRARQTAELAGVLGRGLPTEIEEDLAEWDYGAYEGLTSPEIKARRPGWAIWTDGAPEGESTAAIIQRVERLLGRLATLRGNIALFGHGHVLRVLALRYLGWPLVFGAQLGLDTATVGKLGVIAGRPGLLGWNR